LRHGNYRDGKQDAQETEQFAADQQPEKHCHWVETQPATEDTWREVITFNTLHGREHAQNADDAPNAPAMRER
jgi:hypothetical protein